MSSSTARNDERRISTWDGLVDMDVEEASHSHLVRTSAPLFCSFEQSRSMRAWIDEDERLIL